MTPDRYSITLARVAETIETLRTLGVPPERVTSIDVTHWSPGVAVTIHIGGASESARELVDLIGDHYELPAAPIEDGNYTRGEHLAKTPVLVFCGRSES